MAALGGWQLVVGGGVLFPCKDSPGFTTPNHAEEGVSSPGPCVHCTLTQSVPLHPWTMVPAAGMMEEVFVDDVNSVEDIVFMGDGALVAGPAREGDYMGLPLMKTTADGTHAVGVLGADTLTNNGGRDDWQNSHPVPDPNPRKLDDEEKQFLRGMSIVKVTMSMFTWTSVCTWTIVHVYLDKCSMGERWKPCTSI